LRTKTEEQSNDANQNRGRFEFDHSWPRNHKQASSSSKNGGLSVTDAPTRTRNKGSVISKLLKTSPKNVAITTEVHEWQFKISNSKPSYMKLKAENKS